MLNATDNRDITSVGPGSPMGELMRQYWIPALLSSELPAPDCDPVRVLLLGERFIAFRDSNGDVGLLADRCPHRGASLFLGRNEEAGLRCIYHGWKFDTAGNCMDMPNEPAESNFRKKVRARALRVVERGGMIWAYLGNREKPPELPHLDYLDAEKADQQVYAYQAECNWLQVLEGDLDTSHFGFLHVGHKNPDGVAPGTFLHHMVSDRAPRYRVVDTEAGASYGAYRNTETPGRIYWRIAHFLFPFYSMIPVGQLGGSVAFVARVPLDDNHTMSYVASAQTSGLTAAEDLFAGLRTLPNSTDWHGRFRSARNMANDFEIDRAQQRSGVSFTGLDGVPLQDRAATESMGPVADRRTEHLGSADVMVIRVRRRLLRAMRALATNGTAPPGVQEPDAYRQRSGGIVLPADADWLEATAGLRAGTESPHEDPALSAGV